MKGELRPRTLARAIAAAFFVWHLTELGWLQHLVDEGQNLYAAYLIQQGKVPIRDFFYHQPPTYVFVLSLFPTSQFWLARLVSLGATVATGMSVYRLGRHAFGSTSRKPVLASGLFLCASLQYWNLLALPNAIMLTFGVLGVELLITTPPGPRPWFDWRMAASAACLTFSIILKPLTLALIPAVALVLWADRARRRRLITWMSAMMAGAMASWVFLLAATDNGFAELIGLQSKRMLRRPTLDAFRELPGFADVLADMSSFDFTAATFSNSFLNYHATLSLVSLDGLLVVGAAVALWRVRRGTAVLPAAHRTLWLAWAISSMLFSLVVWDVSYEHYNVLLLPPLALLSATALSNLQLTTVTRRLRWAGITLYVVVNTLAIHTRRHDYQPVLTLDHHNAPVMAFDPFVNVIMGAEAACGMISFPLPPYAGHLDGSNLTAEERGFDASVSNLIECLKASPETLVVVHHLSGLGFALFDEALHAYILERDPQTVIFAPESVKQPFLDLFAPDSTMPQGDPRLLAPHLP